MQKKNKMKVKPEECFQLKLGPHYKKEILQFKQVSVIHKLELNYSKLS